MGGSTGVYTETRNPKPETTLSREAPRVRRLRAHAPRLARAEDSAVAGDGSRVCRVEGLEFRVLGF